MGADELIACKAGAAQVMVGGMKVFKYHLFHMSALPHEAAATVTLDIPTQSKLLNIIERDGVLFQYAAVYPGMEKMGMRQHTYKIIGTGYDLPPELSEDDYGYVGSFATDRLSVYLVAHVFRLKDAPIIP